MIWNKSIKEWKKLGKKFSLCRKKGTLVINGLHHNSDIVVCGDKYLRKLFKQIKIIDVKTSPYYPVTIEVSGYSKYFNGVSGRYYVECKRIIKERSHILINALTNIVALFPNFMTFLKVINFCSIKSEIRLIRYVSI
jgi:hypothetical protein